jgi:hypothetical protein
VLFSSSAFSAELAELLSGPAEPELFELPQAAIMTVPTQAARRSANNFFFIVFPPLMKKTAARVQRPKDAKTDPPQYGDRSMRTASYSWPGASLLLYSVGQVS